MKTVSHPTPSPSKEPSMQPSYFGPSALPSMIPPTTSPKPTLTTTISPSTNPSTSPTNANTGGDPHFEGFHEHFSFMGECDLLLLSTTFTNNSCNNTYNEPQADSTYTRSQLQIHIRTTMKLDYSYISGVAFLIGKDSIELNEKGQLWINQHLVPPKELVAMQETMLPFKVKHSLQGTKRKIVVHNIDLPCSGLSFEVRANLRNHMIYVSTSGPFGEDTVGLLGSPVKEGFFNRDGVDVTAEGDTDAYTETWQIRHDKDPKIFIHDREPQFPARCLYPAEVEKTKMLRGRLLRGAVGKLFKKTITKKDAKEACKSTRGVKNEFCVEDVLRTGDVNLARHSFYH